MTTRDQFVAYVDRMDARQRFSDLLTRPVEEYLTEYCGSAQEAEDASDAEKDLWQSICNHLGIPFPPKDDA